MKYSEILRLVWINLMQNKFKVILTSIGIVVGAATIVMVIAIGRGGQMEVADQFKNLNAGAIDISFEMTSENSSGKTGKAGVGMPSNGESQSGKGTQSGGGMPSGGGLPSGGGMPSGGDMPSGNFNMKDFMNRGNFFEDNRVNKEKVTLTEDDMDDLEVFVPDVSQATISYSEKSTIDGGNLDEEATYEVAGVKCNYAEISNLTMAVGDFITESDEESKNKICILGASAAKEIFGSVTDAYDSTVYIDGRAYIVNGILEEMGSVASGISPDGTIFIPYSTGVKYISGTDTNPTITIISSDVEKIDDVRSNIETVLASTYPNTEFTITDAGSKMEAASASNDTLTMLLIAMAVIVFIVGGIGIMNVLFVSVKERTSEIGILKALGCRKKDILLEFLLEAGFISILGGILGVCISFLVTPVVESLSVRVELSVVGALLAVIFAFFTGTIFGFYPALKASKLVPVEALSDE